jgi:hypothetical protein
MDDDEVELPAILLPGYEARQSARALIVLALLVPAVALFLFIAAPGFMGGGGTHEPGPIAILVPLSGVGMFLFGLGWMVRIYRASIDVEPDHGNWRYRSR